MEYTATLPQKKQLNYESYTIGAEAKIKINETRGDYFFLPYCHALGPFFLHLPKGETILRY